MPNGIITNITAPVIKRFLKLLDFWEVRKMTFGFDFGFGSSTDVHEEFSTGLGEEGGSVGSTEGVGLGGGATGIGDGSPSQTIVASTATNTFFVSLNLFHTHSVEPSRE
ncbi:MAG: hypothetical protein F6K11_35200 [Leptolyngbya sp. SIO3F4]|nr:hypothetical protein [Leptolyngbya sp. SIO3F4]